MIEGFIQHLFHNFIFFCFLSERDGKPVYPAQKSVSFLNNNKVSSTMNGMASGVQTLPVTFWLCYIFIEIQLCFVFRIS